MELPIPRGVTAVGAALTVLAACHAGPPAVHPEPPPPAAVADPAVIARGQYLVNGPAHCVACHTPAGPLSPVDAVHKPALVGGYAFAVPGGTVRAPNLTSDSATGIGARSDAVLVRALRYGRGFDGRPLLPFMELQGLSDDDLTAVLSYLRSVPPAHSVVKVRSIGFFGRLLIGFFVHAHGPSAPPPRHSPVGPSVERGEYLVNRVAMCVSCHTRRSKTGGYKGERLAGGYRMADELDAARELVTPNLTPDPETGCITGWTERQFLARFRAGRSVPGSPMPWASFALMTDDDLRSVYRYLMSLAPVRNPALARANPDVEHLGR